MKARSASAKGKRFETHLLDWIRSELDANAYHPKGSGSGTEKGDIVIPSLNATVEAKNQKTIKLLEWWSQAKEECFNEIPILAIRNPRYAEFKETLVVMSKDDLLHLLNRKNEPNTVVYELDYDTRNALNSLKSAITRVMNKIPHE